MATAYIYNITVWQAMLKVDCSITLPILGCMQPIFVCYLYFFI